MLKATIIYEQKGTVCYNCFGQQLFIDELYELDTPFYACYVEGNNNIISAFQEKCDLIQWMTSPLFRNHTKKEIAV